MKQRSLAVVSLYAPTAAITALSTSGVTTIGANAGYTNVGRREMKVIVSANIGANTTAFAVQIQEATTAGGNDAANVTGATATLTTTGTTEFHFSTNKGFLKVVATPSGTTASVVPLVSVLLEKRAI